MSDNSLPGPATNAYQTMSQPSLMIHHSGRATDLPKVCHYMFVCCRCCPRPMCDNWAQLNERAMLVHPAWPCVELW
eukprot:2991635-Lingulodinium_polyedra.AAC.1